MHRHPIHPIHLIHLYPSYPPIHYLLEILLNLLRGPSRQSHQLLQKAGVLLHRVLHLQNNVRGLAIDLGRYGRRQ